MRYQFPAISHRIEALYQCAFCEEDNFYYHSESSLNPTAVTNDMWSAVFVFLCSQAKIVIQHP